MTVPKTFAGLPRRPPDTRPIGQEPHDSCANTCGLVPNGDPWRSPEGIEIKRRYDAGDLEVDDSCAMGVDALDFLRRTRAVLMNAEGEVPA